MPPVFFCAMIRLGNPAEPKVQTQCPISPAPIAQVPSLQSAMDTIIPHCSTCVPHCGRPQTGRRGRSSCSPSARSIGWSLADSQWSAGSVAQMQQRPTGSKVPLSSPLRGPQRPGAWPGNSFWFARLQPLPKLVPVLFIPPFSFSLSALLLPAIGIFIEPTSLPITHYLLISRPISNIIRPKLLSPARNNSSSLLLTMQPRGAITAP